MTRSGAITGFFLCFFISYANIVFLFVMMTFVLTGSFATRYKLDLKQSKIHENDDTQTSTNQKKAARNYKQVLCNGAIACFYSIGYCWKTNYSGQSVPIDSEQVSSIYSIGFLFTIVCCCADTLGRII
jgi:uncharacterized membrane protein